MEKKTYAEWRAVGRQVKHGEKAHAYIYGEAVFTKEQTKERVYPRAFTEFGDIGDYDGLWNGMTEEDFLGYTPGDQ